jgi:hypothetical protein
MKKIINTLILLVFSAVTLYGQEDFRVIKVNGTIFIKTRGISLETGTTFNEKEDLLFRSEDATAAVINSQRGRMVITGKNHDLASAKSNYLPSMYNISSRAGSLSKSSDLSAHFSGKYVVLDKHGVKIDKVAFPMDKDHFFFLRYTYKGEEINKKLPGSNDTLIIDRSSLFTVDGNPIPHADNTLIKLFYRKGKESVFISEFDLIFPDMIQLGKEAEIILNETGGKPAGDKIKEVGSYITEFYGKVQVENLSSWMKTRFGIK